MQEELVSLLKTAGRLCLEPHDTSDVNQQAESPLCANLTSFLRHALVSGGSVAAPTAAAGWTADDGNPPGGVNFWPTGTADNVSWIVDNGSWTGNGSLSAAEQEPPDYGSVFMAALSVILGIVILITVIGNVFVIAAILLERNLQNVANYLIVSLAVADLMVACLVMPLGAVYEISRGWILGPELCDMWTSSDVLCCTASILHLVAIAVDRYWAVTNVDYIHTRNGGRIVAMIVVVWSVALVVSLAPQFGWKDPDYLDRINLQQKCMVSQDLGYQIFATCSTFYVPLLVILVLYWKIFQTARKRIRRRRTKPNTLTDSGRPTRGRFKFLSRKKLMGDWDKKKGDVALVEGSICEIDAEKAGSDGGGDMTTAFTIVENNGGGGCGDTTVQVSPERSTAEVANNSSKSESVTVVAAKPKRDTKKESIEAKRERKAAKTLAIITGAFVVCWLPFFLMALLMPLCPDSCHINEYLSSLFLWLGYFNSTLNPVIYTIFSPEFRMAFKRILCGVSHNRPRKHR